MRIGTPIPHKKARIEIVPLIDIMFFLLACFMVVSLSMVQMKGMKINLPTAASSTAEQKNDFISVTVDAGGEFYLDKEKVTLDGLYDGLKKLVAVNPETRIYIRGDTNSTHGDVVNVLDKVKLAGVTKVAFEIRPKGLGGAPTPPAPGAGAPAATPALPVAPATP